MRMTTDRVVDLLLEQIVDEGITTSRLRSREAATVAAD
jgi:hypothetical protein